MATFASSTTASRPVGDVTFAVLVVATVVSCITTVTIALMLLNTMVSA